MAWQPQEAGVQQLSQLLKDSLSGTPQEREKQKQAEAVSFNMVYRKEHGILTTSLARL